MFAIGPTRLTSISIGKRRCAMSETVANVPWSGRHCIGGASPFVAGCTVRIPHLFSRIVCCLRGGLSVDRAVTGRNVKCHGGEPGSSVASHRDTLRSQPGPTDSSCRCAPTWLPQRHGDDDRNTLDSAIVSSPERRQTQALVRVFSQKCSKHRTSARLLQPQMERQ